jgi:hypothetical protein
MFPEKQEIAAPFEKRPWFAMTSIMIVYETNHLAIFKKIPVF